MPGEFPGKKLLVEAEQHLGFQWWVSTDANKHVTKRCSVPGSYTCGN